MKKIPFNLVYLKYFCDAVRSNSISVAAKLNHVSQSAVSQGICKLEEGLDCLLISHQPNRFRVTEEGMQLFSHALSIFKAIKKAEDDLSQGAERITFACTHSFATCCLPDIIKQSQEKIPNLKFNVRIGQYYSIKEWIKKGLIDFAILIDNDDLSSFERLPLYSGHFGLYVAKEMQDPSTLSFLLDCDERIETNRLKDAYRAQWGKELPILMEVSSWSVIEKLVLEGVGIGLFPDYIALRNPGLKPVFDELMAIPYTLFALFDKNITPSIEALQFLELFSRSALKLSVHRQTQYHLEIPESDLF